MTEVELRMVLVALRWGKQLPQHKVHEDNRNRSVQPQSVEKPLGKTCPPNVLELGHLEERQRLGVRQQVVAEHAGLHKPHRLVLL